MFPDPEAEQCRDDASQHGGRVRSFSHQRGNWATHVYIPWGLSCDPGEEFGELLDELLNAARGHGVRLTKMEEFHISQSQTVVLRHHWIEPLVQALRERLGTMRRFLCVADRLKVYTNQEKTRTFLGLEVSVGRPQLLEVVAEVDQSLQEFDLETFYPNPSFHVSLAWCVGNAEDRLQGSTLKQLQRLLEQFEDSARLTRFLAQEIRCKAGNKVFSIPLH
ncbi:U6 snRNA phosphodiesterase 1 [Gastrophryne carolinensis]